jgi:hypothetical protein
MQKKNTSKGKKSSTKTQPTTNADSRKVKGSTNSSKRESKKMSANMKATTPGTSGQKKAHALALVGTASKKQVTRSKKHDPLAPYRANARKLIELYFNPDTPAFVEDLLSSYFTRLEGDTQIFWNRREVLDILLPLWLEDIDRGDGIDILSCTHPAYIAALHESLSCNAPEDDISRPRPTRDDLYTELERDAEALSRLIHSPHTPKEFRQRLLEMMDEVRLADDSPEVIRVAYPLAVLRLQEAEVSAVE